MSDEQVRELIKKYGITIGYLKGMRHRAEMNGWHAMVADINQLLTSLGEAQ